MHFITGGAFNGKSRWVIEHYELNDPTYLWISAYEGMSIPAHTDNWIDIVILEGLEKWIQEWSSQLSSHEVRENWRSFLQIWLKWEKESEQRKLILIGTDLSKGIVPMIAEERKWRDVTGWVYQDVAASAEKFDLIWYGISQKIK
ncbi:adenosyl cobinamide kinase/adenosyl cobinamide phosphate guanylyltransferase [Cytobacillus eiseniae]|uniref:Adenosyl cobinamide kinase/adenosyl cobinamide phosphate guanylyltransferase n=1 Tax=Cytobacillus eiseniae TaxID=762947 RepID=A0ABS4RJ26_9BACI|nr:bifunctional adenosylcobinamide kinase/adenosylcobinamide-phosphate guanylyltransferase [Cytobacillus eiseniae]MBP2242411.1 adenosyl cobinamide kinase/adenosyl cobinamide phosphate guanylyltransferase [Cytobacillus eiseniae]